MVKVTVSLVTMVVEPGGGADTVDDSVAVTVSDTPMYSLGIRKSSDSEVVIVSDTLMVGLGTPSATDSERVVLSDTTTAVTGWIALLSLVETVSETEIERLPAEAITIPMAAV